MAITLAQAVGGAVADATSALDLVFGSNVTSGNRIVICIAAFDDIGGFANTQFTKQAGTATIGAFTLDHSRYDATRDQGVAIASALVTGTGSLTIRFTTVGGNDYFVGGRLELASDTGWDAGFLEDTADAGGSSTTPATGDMTSAGAAIFVAALAVSTGSNITITPGGDYTQVFEEQDGTAHMVGGFEYRIVGTGTTDSPDWTITNSPWDVAGVVYKGVAGGGGTPVAGSAAGSSTLTATQNVRRALNPTVAAVATPVVVLGRRGPISFAVAGVAAPVTTVKARRATGLAASGVAVATAVLGVRHAVQYTIDETADVTTTLNAGRAVSQSVGGVAGVSITLNRIAGGGVVVASAAGTSTFSASFTNLRPLTVPSIGATSSATVTLASTHAVASSVVGLATMAAAFVSFRNVPVAVSAVATVAFDLDVTRAPSTGSAGAYGRQHDSAYLKLLRS